MNTSFHSSSTSYTMPGDFTSGVPNATVSRSPDEAIRAIEARVREKPAEAEHRWALFQWLCIVGDWHRAIQQLQAYAQLEAASAASRTTSASRSSPSLVHAFRDLVRAERARAQVMAGKHEPGFLFDDVPVWMSGLHAALGLAAQGEIEAADAARETALDMAPLVSGRCERKEDIANDAPERVFSWIGDSDSRLGPICEFIAAGRYRWLAFDDIARWQIARPAMLVDLVWARCTLTLRDGTLLRGFMPARYPQAALQDSSCQDRDALIMGRTTVWHTSGRTGVIGSGAKTWTTSAGDFGIFDLLDCTFGSAESGEDDKK